MLKWSWGCEEVESSFLLCLVLISQVPDSFCVCTAEMTSFDCVRWDQILMRKVVKNVHDLKKTSHSRTQSKVNQCNSLLLI